MDGCRPGALVLDWGGAAAESGVTGDQCQYGVAGLGAPVACSVWRLDTKEGIALYRRAYVLSVNDAPAIWLYQAPALAGMSVTVNPAGMRGDMWWVNLAQWSLSDSAAPKSAAVAVATSAH